MSTGSEGDMPGLGDKGTERRKGQKPGPLFVRMDMGEQGDEVPGRLAGLTMEEVAQPPAYAPGTLKRKW
jgi:hypothetical protein